MHRIAPALLTLLALGILVACVVGGGWATWTLALGAAAFPPALLALTLRRRGPFLVVVVGLLALLAGATLLVLTGSGRIFFGLSLAAWAMLLGLGLLPLLWTSAAFALVQDDGTEDVGEAPRR